MGTLASGSIDLKSLKVAGEGATSYITAIDSDNGIKVHAANNINLNYTQITSEGMEIFKTDGAESNPSAISVAKFGSTVRIGKTNEAHIVQTSTGLNFIDSSGITQASMTANNGTFILEDVVSAHKIELGSGLTIENNQGEILASFSGSGSQIGLESEGHIVTESDGITLYADDTEELLTIAPRDSASKTFASIYSPTGKLIRIFSRDYNYSYYQEAYADWQYDQSVTAVHLGATYGTTASNAKSAIIALDARSARTSIDLSADFVRMPVESATPAISRSTGASISNVVFKRSGNVAQLRFTYTYSTSVAAGANLFTGTLASGYRPTIGVLGVSYYNQNAIIGAIGTDGAITLRNASSTALTASSGGAISFTYIID